MEKPCIIESFKEFLKKGRSYYYYRELDTPDCENIVNYVECLEKALDKMCRIFDEEIHNCDFLLIRNGLCDSKCTLCDQEKRVELMKEWVMKDEED